MGSCVYCQTPLSGGPPWAPGAGHRLAYDPKQGRLWSICPSCGRWNLTPLDQRWESLEACEEAVQTRGTVLLATPHLSLVDVEEGELVRIGEPPRLEFVDWRYGPRLPEGPVKEGFLTRLLGGLPPPPVDGYDPYGLVLRPTYSEPWLASPFLGQASHLTYLFSQVPLAPECPSCGQPMAIKPWSFQEIQLLERDGGIGVLAACGLCRDQVLLPLHLARATLRLGLGLVTPPSRQRELAVSAAQEIEGEGGAGALVRHFARDSLSLGSLSALQRSGLIISLDEMAELEALEAEWKRAEEMASIMDGELSEIPGFQEFRRDVLDGRP